MTEVQATQQSAEPLQEKQYKIRPSKKNQSRTRICSSTARVNSREETGTDRESVVQQILRLDQQAEQKLGDSRTRHLTNVGTQNTDETAYLAMWRRKCERIGSNNYPPGKLQGELTMRVVIHHSGNCSKSLYSARQAIRYLTRLPWQRCVKLRRISPSTWPCASVMIDCRLRALGNSVAAVPQ